MHIREILKSDKEKKFPVQKNDNTLKMQTFMFKCSKLA